MSLCAPTALADIVLRVTPPEAGRKTESLQFLSNNNVDGGRATHRISTPFLNNDINKKDCSNIKISFCVLFSHESCLEKSKKIVHAKVSLRTSTVSHAYSQDVYISKTLYALFN